MTFQRLLIRASGAVQVRESGHHESVAMKVSAVDWPSLNVQFGEEGGRGAGFRSNADRPSRREFPGSSWEPPGFSLYLPRDKLCIRRRPETNAVKDNVCPGLTASSLRGAASPPITQELR